MRFIIPILFLVLFISPFFLSSAISKTCARYDPNGRAIHYDCSQPKSINFYQPYWKTKTTTINGKVTRKQIILDSVCYNYPKGRMDYQTCRHEAARYFSKQCKELREKYKTVKQPHHEQFKLDMDMFCEAEVKFIP